MINIPIETERKFLIKMLDISALSALENIQVKKIVQTYLPTEKGLTHRVRKICTEDTEKFVFTEKRRINNLSCFENEYEISKTEYEQLLAKYPNCTSISKTRYCIPHLNHILEIDVYDFWSDRAILEIELCNESENFTIPTYLSVIKEVSDDPRYKNVNLANSPVFENLL